MFQYNLCTDLIWKYTVNPSLSLCLNYEIFTLRMTSFKERRLIATFGRAVRTAGFVSDAKISQKHVQYLKTVHCGGTLNQQQKKVKHKKLE